MMTVTTQAGSTDAQDILARLATRFSCRDFAPVAIDRETLAAIVADGVQAPSSCNQQQWHFIVVDDDAAKIAARDIAGGNHHFAECSALIFLCFQKGWTHNNFSVVQSVAGACYHMMLSAHLRGFSSIWNAGIGDHGRLRALLGLPDTFEPQGALALGVPRDTAPRVKAPRRPIDEVHSWNRFERPAHTMYPVKPAPAYPYFSISNENNPYAEWDPTRWTWDQVADFRGYSVWAKSPLAGVYVSRRQGDATERELDLLATTPEGARVVDIMPWGGTATTQLARRLSAGSRLVVAELSPHNLSFVMERLSREGLSMDTIEGAAMRGASLPFPDASIDAMTAFQALEHMPDPEAFLDEARRVLRPDGQLVVSVRNRSSDYGDGWERDEARGQVPNQGPFTPLAAERVRAWLAQRFTIEAEAGIAVDADGSAVVETGDARLSRRVYAARCRPA
ncbi:MAG: nitroreductase family protein [Microvirga sp.]|nr:nitroreductase family protein [Microvirga sp.]